LPWDGKLPVAGVARFLQRTIEFLLHKEFAAESLPVIDATFERTGNSLGTVEERVVAVRKRAYFAPARG